jgi:hypothetical protein
LGACRRWWMPFRAPFLTACERFAENTSSSRINLFKRLFYYFILNQAIEFLPNPFRRGCPRPIGCIQRYHAVGGANGTTMVVMFVGGLCRWSTKFLYYSYSRKPTGREFFVPARILIAVFLLKLTLTNNINLIGGDSLFISYWPLPATMDAVSATIVAGRRAWFQYNKRSIEINWFLL